MRFLVVFLAQWLLALRLAALAAGATPPAPWPADPVLSAYAVQQLVAGPEGYLWAATDDGVRRYDGYEAVPLARLLRPGSAPAPGGYTNLMADRAGQLWISSATGLHCYRPATGQLTRLPLPLAPAEPAAVRSLWLDGRTGRLWVGYGHGRLLSFDPARPQLPRRPPPSLSRGQDVLRLAPATGGAVWATAADNGVLVLDGRGHLRHRYRLPLFVLPVPGTRPQQVVSAQACFVVDSLTGRLREVQRWLFGPVQGDFRFYPEGDAAGRPVAWLARGQCVALRWPAGAAGAARPTVRVQPLATGPDAPAPGRVYSLVRDPTGLRWAFSPGYRGGHREGPPPAVQQLPLARPLANPSVRGLTRLPDGRLLVSTYGGGLTQAADSPAVPLQPLPLRSNQPARPLLICYALLTSRAGRVLYATEGGSGFGELNLRTGLGRQFGTAPGSGEGNSMQGHCLLQSRGGALWGGAVGGLYQLNEVSRQFARYRAADPAWPLHACDVRHLAEDAAGLLWLATDHGLFGLNPATGALRHFGPDEVAAHQRLPTADLLTVWPDPATGQLWLGTRAAGLLAVQPGRGVVRQLTPAQGLPEAPVATLQPGPGGTLWAGTYAGLVRYVPATDQLTVFGPADGLNEPELNQQAAFRDHDGTLYFGGIGGLYRVRPGRSLAPGLRPPRLLFTARTRADTVAAWLPDGQPPADGLRLPGPTAEAGFDLSLSDLRNPAQAHFYYQLTPAGGPPAPVRRTDRHLRLPGLAAGTYTLAVWGQTAAGRRSPARRLAVTVARPWWQHPAALLGAALGLLGAGALVQQLRSRRALREARLRTRIAADLHDEVGALLTRVSMRAELLHEAAPAATPGVDALLADSRTALATMRDVVWSIDAGADTVGALLDRLRDHLEQAAEPAGLRTTLTVAGLPDALPLPPQLRQHLYLLTKEAITNAVRHAHGATELHVALRREGRRLTLTVIDDGQLGRVGTGGLGLRSMQQRAAAVGGVLTAGRVAGGWEVRLVVA